MLLDYAKFQTLQTIVFLATYLSLSLAMQHGYLPPPPPPSLPLQVMIVYSVGYSVL